MPNLQGVPAAEVNDPVEEALQYMIKLAGVTDGISTALDKQCVEIAALKAEVNKLRLAIANVATDWPNSASGVPRATRSRSASLEAHAAPSAKRARPAPAGSSTDRPLWSIRLGPYSPLAAAQSGSLLNQVVKIIDELDGAHVRRGPCAVLADKDANFALVYFTSKRERDNICAAWPPTDPKFRTVRVEKADDLEPPLSEALLKDLETSTPRSRPKRV